MATEITTEAGTILREEDLTTIIKVAKLRGVTKWKDVGLMLNFQSSELEMIGKDLRLLTEGPTGYFRTLLSQWLKWAPPNRDFPTLEALLEALRSYVVGEHKLALDLEDHFKTKGRVISTMKLSTCKPPAKIEVPNPQQMTTPMNIPTHQKMDRYEEFPTNTKCNAEGKQSPTSYGIYSKDEYFFQAISSGLMSGLLKIKSMATSMSMSVNTGRNSLPSAVSWGQVKLQKDMKTPEPMCGGSAVCDHNKAYFLQADSRQVLCLTWSNSQFNWKGIALCPFRDSGLAIVNRALIAVGGWDGLRYSNQLFEFKEEKNEWIENEEFPPMNAARRSPAIVSTTDGNCTSLYLIGGCCCNDTMSTPIIEYFNTDSKVWSAVRNAQELSNLCNITATLCDRHVFVVGNDGKGFSALLETLQSDTVTWLPIPSLPVHYSATTSLHGQLVSIGGLRDDSSDNSIYQLVDQDWVEIGCMASPREMCLVVNPTPLSVIVVGGWHKSLMTKLDHVEVFNVT